MRCKLCTTQTRRTKKVGEYLVHLPDTLHRIMVRVRDVRALGHRLRHLTLLLTVFKLNYFLIVLFFKRYYKRVDRCMGYYCGHFGKPSGRSRIRPLYNLSCSSITPYSPLPTESPYNRLLSNLTYSTSELPTQASDQVQFLTKIYEIHNEISQ